MKYLIWGDTHLRYKLLEDFLHRKASEFDGFIFGGDFFHQFNDTVEQNKTMARFIKERILKLPNVKICLGNHDFCHKHSIGNKTSRLTYCPGWTEEKDKAINSVLTPSDWALFKDYHLVDGWLISHAGFALAIYGHPLEGFDLKYLDPVIERAYDDLTARKLNYALDVGFARGGHQPFGGHLWQCWSEIWPLENQKQIVFHTPHQHPDCKYYTDDLGLDESYKLEQFGPHIKQDNPSLTVCLDTNNRYYGILDNGHLTVDFTV